MNALALPASFAARGTLNLDEASRLIDEATSVLALGHLVERMLHTFFGKQARLFAVRKYGLVSHLGPGHNDAPWSSVAIDPRASILLERVLATGKTEVVRAQTAGELSGELELDSTLYACVPISAQTKIVMLCWIGLSEVHPNRLGHLMSLTAHIEARLTALILERKRALSQERTVSERGERAGADDAFMGESVHLKPTLPSMPLVGTGAASGRTAETRQWLNVLGVPQHAPPPPSQNNTQGEQARPITQTINRSMLRGERATGPRAHSSAAE